MLDAWIPWDTDSVSLERLEFLSGAYIDLIETRKLVLAAGLFTLKSTVRCCSRLRRNYVYNRFFLKEE